MKTATASIAPTTTMVGVELSRYNTGDNTAERRLLIAVGTSLFTYDPTNPGDVNHDIFGKDIETQLEMRRRVWAMFDSGWCVSDSPRVASADLPEHDLLFIASDILPGFYQAAAGQGDVDVEANVDAQIAALDAALQSAHFTRTGRQAPRYPDLTGVASTPVAPSGDTGESDDYNGEFYLRPNGQKYWPQAIRDQEDVSLLRRARAEKMSVLLWGAPGCGKTALVEAAFPDLITIVGEVGMSAIDLFGGFQPVPGSPGEYEWVDGKAVIAAQTGVPLFIDELALIDPAVLSKIYPASDDRRVLMLEGRPGGDVVCEDGFVVIGAFNPFVPGARISEAMWSRFTLKVDYRTDYALAYRLGVPKPVIEVALSMDDSLRTGSDSIGWAPQMRELLRYRDLLAAFGEEIALGALISEAPIDVQSEVAERFAVALGAKKAQPLATSITNRNLFK